MKKAWPRPKPAASSTSTRSSKAAFSASKTAMVMVDIGFKSEGSIPLDEWDEGEEPPQVGQLVRVLIEDLEDEQAQPEDGGMVRISKRKAEKHRRSGTR